MWFITTTHTIPKFYRLDGVITEPAINWVYAWTEGNLHYQSTQPHIGDPTQALEALNVVGVTGFSTKAEARDVAKGFGIKIWKCLSISEPKPAKVKAVSFAELKERAFQDPEVREAYDALTELDKLNTASTKR
ncbi:hypothetical protein [Shewanella dokdonensis]|uniref:Uncharacterized protein n=1 Tax=Shewanella dokdonensis TaxID=712036 RepID=A0ABX8DHK7_9GAMM|nr:hypothetical protein [Shewanella dokdonensis]MCL1076493.1 hypothetical protein [Shewanella dokdonensis]QVK23287.1 hypothetical protein KHX94_00110 [Shewanella dokdonensis]